MDLFEKGERAEHFEFGVVTILDYLTDIETDPVRYHNFKTSGGTEGHRIYLCTWQGEDGQTIGMLPDVALSPCKPLDGSTPLQGGRPNGYERDIDAEAAAVTDALEAFDFENVVKAVKIMALVSPDDFGFYEEIPHFRSADALREVAQRELTAAFENMHKYATAENAHGDVDGEWYWRYEIDGVFDVDVYWSVPGGADLVLKFSLSEYGTI